MCVCVCIEKGKMIHYGVQAEDMTYWMPLLTSAKGHVFTSLPTSMNLHAMAVKCILTLEQCSASMI